MKKINSFGFIKLSEKAASVLLLVLLSLGGGFAGGYYAYKNADKHSSGSAQAIVNTQQELINNIVDEVGPSVVSINVQSNKVQNTYFGPQNYTQESAGTGFIVSKDGYVVTNRHVVPNGSTKVSITLSDGTTLDNVEVVGRTSASDSLDIAILKIKDKKGKNLVVAELGDSEKVRVGDSVVAIGNALGQLQNTVTSGIISGYGRDVSAGEASEQENLVNLFQTDAAINSGNSGGPLVNSNGQVIGINTAVAGGGAQNIGFAIPINDVKGVIKSVLGTGELKRPFLGIHYVSLTPEIVKQQKLKVDQGAYLVSSGSTPAVVPDSPADKAGLKEGDIITEVNSQKVDQKQGITSILGQYSAGDEITLSVLRGGKELKLTVTLSEFKN